MKRMPILRTRRLTIQLQELSVGESISIASMPPSLEQAEVTATLRAALQSVSDGSDPIDWTVEERTMAICHYLASVDTDGPDFKVGENGRFSDYLDASSDICSLDPVFVDEVGGDKWSIRPLTGRLAESIERLRGELKLTNDTPVPTSFHWLLGAMAAQLIREGEIVPASTVTDGALDEWLLDRMAVMKSYPETEFLNLVALYWRGREAQKHLFSLYFGKDGIVFLPTEKEGAEELPPCRFPVDACFSTFTLQVAGRS